MAKLNDRCFCYFMTTMFASVQGAIINIGTLYKAGLKIMDNGQCPATKVT